MAKAKVSNDESNLPRVAPRQIAGVVAGNALEVYDFITYAYFAVYIGRTFFPSDDPTTSLLASLATFAAGFVTRPIGALVIGRYGDRVGRKPAMLLSFSLMGLASLGLALTPSYAAIGIAAPIAAVLFRLLQGFALGGEIGPSTTFLVEAAPPGKRGLYASFQYMGTGAAGLVAGLIGVLLSRVLTETELTSIGWRVAMLVGVAVIPVGLLLRRTLAETLHSGRIGEVEVQGAQHGAVKATILGLVLISAGATVAYVLGYLATYAIATLHMPPSAAFTATALSGVVGVTMSPVGGWLSDRFGRKPVIIFSWLFMLAAIFPAFHMLIGARTPIALYMATVFTALGGSVGAAAVLPAVTESLPRHARSTGLSLAYAFGIMVFGGTAQFNIAWLTRTLDRTDIPAWYMAGATILGLIAVSGLRETAPARLRNREARSVHP